MTAATNLAASLAAIENTLTFYSVPYPQRQEVLDLVRAIIAQARAELIAELKPVAWRWTSIGHHYTSSTAYAEELKGQEIPVVPLAIIPKA
ncbi:MULTISPECIES: hypothetical protein [unclassified Achromobacter]|uniref:hypothetical protein n=1 Tax=unclassified Achromobacter TaxID=2626865 RepID=UPI000B51AAFA|nr:MULTISPECIES: hypothetical protein [unclassified Achromobacter]OWT67296.1 hypothetical protein CEY05_30680 [Achromobacter sp. HZ34]OWT67319.1 hypothetical protein CEY04_30675 [Achromobacter sp. HZ28]